MRELLHVELTRLRWRRAVVVLLLACLLVPAAIWVGTAWSLGAGAAYLAVVLMVVVAASIWSFQRRDLP